MEKPQKKSNYTYFNSMEDANSYSRSVEKDLQNIFQYVGNMGVTKTVTIAGTTLVIQNGVIIKVT